MSSILEDGKLRRVKQCEKCPWKVSTDPNTIPDGYSRELHAGLKSTIASRHMMSFGGTMAAMACHESPQGLEAACVGWLMNQLGPGNNIGLRMQMMRCTNGHAIQLDGPQHQTFEQTLPKRRKRRIVL